MSDWEDFCESQGLNPGCPDDYERFLEMLETPSSKRRHVCEPDYTEEDEQEELIFTTFQEAAEWSRNNRGKPFTRSADGAHFVPKESFHKAQNKLTGAHAYRNQPLPEGSGWVPGSYPTTNEEELFAKDFEHQRQTFKPLLRKLAPNIARQADRGNYYLHSSMDNLRKHTLSELKELQALLEERVKRCECWYSTQREDSLSWIAKREKAGYDKEPWLKKRDQNYKNNFKKPKELVFWETALKLVREEHIHRLEEIDTYQAEAKAMGLG
jgi:hypothetical protein